MILRKALDNILFSIIIPFYNGVEYLEKILDCILRINYDAYEILVINDGTPISHIPDGFFENIQAKSSHIYIYHKENGGIADARNYGLNRARGKYIFFCDQDDEVDTSMYLSCITLMEENNVDAVISNCYVQTPTKRILSNQIKKDETLNGDSLFQLKKWLLMGEVLSYDGVKVQSTVWNCAFKSSIIREHGLSFKAHISYDDDYVFLVNYLDSCKSIYLTSSAFYIWNDRSTSESHTKKYLTNIVERYESLYQFKWNHLIAMNLSEIEKQKFNSYFWANTLYRFICNETTRTRIRSTVNDNQELIQSILRESKYNFSITGFVYLMRTKGKRAGLIYLLSANHLWRLAMKIVQ